MGIYLKHYVTTLAAIALPILFLATALGRWHAGSGLVLLGLVFVAILGPLLLLPWAVLLGALHIRLLEGLLGDARQTMTRSAMLGGLAGLLPVAALFGLPFSQWFPTAFRLD